MSQDTREKIDSLSNKAITNPQILKFNGIDVESATGAVPNFITISEGDEVTRPTTNDDPASSLDSSRYKREQEEKEQAEFAKIWQGKEIEGAPPKPKTENLIEEDYLGELIKLVKANGQEMFTRRSQYEIMSGKNMDLVLDTKGTIKYQRMDVDGPQIQSYVGLNARHKFSKNNKQINLKLNTDLITDTKVGEAFFRNTINTLKDSGIEMYRINIVNPEYKFILDEFLKKDPTINDSPKFEINQDGDVVQKDLSKSEPEKEKQLKRIEGSFNFGTKVVNEKTPKAQLDDIFEKVRIKVEHLNDGEFTKITKLDAEPNGETLSTIVKTADLGRKEVAKGQPVSDEPSKGQHVYKIFSDALQATNDNKATATEQKPLEPANPALQGIQAKAESGKPEAPSANVDEPGAKESVTVQGVTAERDLGKTLDKVLNQSAGIITNFEANAEKEKITFGYDKEKKMITANFVDEPSIKFDLDLSKSRMGQALIKNIGDDAHMTFTSKTNELKEKGELNKEIRKVILTSPGA
jgi:hypothetical protein